MAFQNVSAIRAGRVISESLSGLPDHAIHPIQDLSARWPVSVRLHMCHDARDTSKDGRASALSTAENVSIARS